MVFDFSGQHLYISTSDGLVQRYNIPLGELDALIIGGFLSGIDIARQSAPCLLRRALLAGRKGLSIK